MANILAILLQFTASGRAAELFGELSADNWWFTSGGLSSIRIGWL